MVPLVILSKGKDHHNIQYKGNPATHQLCWMKKQLLESALPPWKSRLACLEKLLMLRAVNT